MATWRVIDIICQVYGNMMRDINIVRRVYSNMLHVIESIPRVYWCVIWILSVVVYGNMMRDTHIILRSVWQHDEWYSHCLNWNTAVWWNEHKNTFENSILYSSLYWLHTQFKYHGPFTRYAKLRVTHAPGMPGTVFPANDFKGNR